MSNNSPDTSTSTLCPTSAITLLPFHYKALRRGENHLHALRAAALAVDAQQRFGAAGAQQQPGLRGVLFCCAQGILEEELDAVQRLLVQHLHAGKRSGYRRNRLRARNRRLLDLLGDVHIDAPVVVFAELLLQRCHELAKRLVLVSHNVREEQTVQQTVTLRQVLRDEIGRAS